MFQKAFKIYEASIFVSCSLPLMVCCLRDQDGLVISNTNVSYGKLKRIMTKRHVVKALFFLCLNCSTCKSCTCIKFIKNLSNLTLSVLTLTCSLILVESRTS